MPCLRGLRLQVRLTPVQRVQNGPPQAVEPRVNGEQEAQEVKFLRPSYLEMSSSTGTLLYDIPAIHRDEALPAASFLSSSSSSACGPSSKKRKRSSSKDKNAFASTTPSHRKPPTKFSAQTAAVTSGEVLRALLLLEDEGELTFEAQVSCQTDLEAELFFEVELNLKDEVVYRNRKHLQKKLFLLSVISDCQQACMRSNDVEGEEQGNVVGKSSDLCLPRVVGEKEVHPPSTTLSSAYESAQELLDERHEREWKAKLITEERSFLQSLGLLSPLSQDTLEIVLNFLGPTDLGRMSVTCRFEPASRLLYLLSVSDIPRTLTALLSLRSIRNVSMAVVPGAILRLLPHQVRCLRWMMGREAKKRAVIDPLYLPLRTTEGLMINVNLITGHYLVGPTPSLPDIPGGMLCDEPGLGKTVTCLSLIAKTRGMRAGTQASRFPVPTSHLPSVMVQDSGYRDGRETSVPAAKQQAMERKVEGYHLRSPLTRKREVRGEDLLSSCATLIIVPSPLLGHWKSQLEKHLSPSSLSRILFDSDRVTKPLPSAETLASCELVVTTFRRLSLEWREGRPACALEERLPMRLRDEVFYGGAGVPGGKRLRVSNLLKVYWVRVIIDEGHSLGTLSITDAGQLASALKAEYKWVMTGTPTPSTSTSNDLKYLYGLLRFLGDHSFGRDDGGRWNNLVAQPFHAKKLRAFRRLRDIVQRIMIRHLKSSIDELRPPSRIHRVLRMSPVEAASYNTIASFCLANLIITGMVDGNHPAGPRHPDNLLNPANRKYAMETLHNLRVACCGGGLQQIAYNHSANSIFSWCTDRRLLHLARTMIRKATAGLREECGYCLQQFQLVLLTPCGHLICVLCMDKVTRRGSAKASGKEGEEDNSPWEFTPYCAVCKRHFDTDEFQAIQPGFELNWKWHDALPATGGKPSASSAVPPALGTTASQPAASSLHSPASITEVTERNTLRNETVGLQPLPPSQLPSSSADVGERGRNNDVLFAEDDESDQDSSWESVSKAKHLIERLREVQREKDLEKKRNERDNLYANLASLPRQLRPQPVSALKAIVFSQFRMYLNGIEEALTSHGFRVAHFFGSKRSLELQRFRDDPGVSVLLLCKEGAHGLDLSFVTHIFLMDEIWDKSLEDQVISRAHRLGQKSSVVVEQLIMDDTVELVMHQRNNAEQGVKGNDQARLHFLLQNLKFVEAVQRGPERKLDVLEGKADPRRDFPPLVATPAAGIADGAELAGDDVRPSARRRVRFADDL